MATLDPNLPVRADHRIIKKLCSSILSGKTELVPKEFDLISRVFIKYGGSWVKLFQGAPSELERIKKVIKAAYKKGLLTKHYSWGK